MEDYIPKVDFEKVKQAADDAANKGAIAEVKSFYEDSYNPFRQQIKDYLIQNSPSIHLDVPGVIALINEKLIAEADKIANEAVARLFIPEALELLSGAPSEISLTEVIKNYVDFNLIEKEDLHYSLKKHHKYDWLTIELGYRKISISLSLHKMYKRSNDEPDTYKFLSLPYNRDTEQQKMVFRVEGGTLEMPFRKDIINDRFLSFIARLIIAGTTVYVDAENIEEENDWLDD